MKRPGAEPPVAFPPPLNICAVAALVMPVWGWLVVVGLVLPAPDIAPFPNNPLLEFEAPDVVPAAAKGLLLT